MIPSCLNLREDQIIKLKNWTKSLSKVRETEEDCVPFSLIKFEIRETGLGDEFWAVCGNKKCCLTIDDDNVLIDILDKENIV